MLLAPLTLFEKTSDVSGKRLYGVSSKGLRYVPYGKTNRTKNEEQDREEEEVDEVEAEREYWYHS